MTKHDAVRWALTLATGCGWAVMLMHSPTWLRLKARVQHPNQRVTLGAGNIQRWQVMQVPARLFRKNAPRPHSSKPVILKQATAVQSHSTALTTRVAKAARLRPSPTKQPTHPASSQPPNPVPTQPPNPAPAQPLNPVPAQPRNPVPAQPLNPAPAQPRNPVPAQPLHPASSQPAASPQNLGGKPVAAQRLDAGFRLLHLPTIQIPLAARRAGLEGWAQLEVSITPQGLVNNVRLLAQTTQAGSGWGYGQAARRAYSQARFSHPTLQGKPVRALLRLTVRFRR